MLDRTVTITPRVVDLEAGLDDRGNETIVDGEPFEVLAMRELLRVEDDTDQRDQQKRTYRYLLAAHDPEGVPVPITGYDRLVDEGETWRIEGTPEYVRRRNRGRIHHVELEAWRVGPGAAGVLP